MRVTVLYHGDPIGSSDLKVEPPFVAGTLEPFDSYAPLRPVFREKWRAMRNIDFLPPGSAAVGGVDAAGAAAGEAALARAAAVCSALELRADDGTVIMVESIDITDWRDGFEVTLDGFLADEEGGVPARLPRTPRGESGRNSSPT